jgi:hypothetical protein
MKPILILITIIFLSSCRTDNKPRIVHSDNDNQEVLKPTKDSTFIEIADLPIEIDSTDYLIHPVGYFKVEDSRGSSIYKSSGWRNQGFSVSNYNGYKLTGNLTNVLFQHKNSTDIIPLTKYFLKIESMTFLKKVADNIKKQYLVYEIKDKDTNLDGDLDYKDVTSLYVSKIDGSQFVKLSRENNELLNWKVVESNNFLYFRTVEDKNKDGAFDNRDTIHYNFINLNAEDLKVVEYKPF